MPSALGQQRCDYANTDPAQMRCSTALLGGPRRAPQSRIRVLRNASADAVAAPQESSQTQAMPRSREEPRKLLGNNRRLSSLSHAARACQPRETSCPHGGGLVQYRRGPWPQQRRRLRRKSAAVKLLGAAQQRAASSAAQTAAPRVWGRRAGLQDSPTHFKAAQASLKQHSSAAAAST